MISVKIYKAKEKDIEILTSMKMLIMINDDLDKTLSVDDKQRIKDDIIKSIKKDYTSYNIIVLEGKTIGCYSVIDYADGKIIDQIYLFSEFRRNHIGSRIVKQIIRENENVYTWCYKDSEALLFFKNMGFLIQSRKGSTLILKYQELDTSALSVCNDIAIGYKDKAGNKYLLLDSQFKDKYYLQGPDELLESKLGLCFDQVELERRILTKLKYDVETYYIMYSNVDYDASHTFLIYEYGGKCYWFENAWLKYRGTHTYDSKEDLLRDVVSKFVKTIDNGVIDNIRLFRYDKPRVGIGYGKLMNNFINGDKIKVKELFK